MAIQSQPETGPASGGEISTNVSTTNRIQNRFTKPEEDFLVSSISKDLLSFIFRVGFGNLNCF